MKEIENKIKSWSLYLGERRKRFRRNEGNPGTYRGIKV